MKAQLPNVADLKSLLATTDFTLEEISDGTGVSLSALGKIKSGARSNPTISTYNRIRVFLEQPRGKRAA